MVDDNVKRKQSVASKANANYIGARFPDMYYVGQP